LALFATVFAAGALGIGLSSVGHNVSLLWPPVGIGFAVLTLYGLRLWPAYWFAILCIALWREATYPMAGAIATIETSSLLVAVYLLRRHVDFDPALRTVRDCRLLLRHTALLAVLPSILGVGALVFASAIPEGRWPTYLLLWVLSEISGVLLFAPMVFQILLPRQGRGIAWARAPEAIMLFVAHMAACMLVFAPISPLAQGQYGVTILVLPTLIWAGLRFSAATGMTAVMVLAAVALWGAAVGTGPLVAPDAFGTLLLTWGYLGMAMIIMLFATVMVREQQKAKRATEESEGLLRGIMDQVPEGIFLLDLTSTPTGRIIYANPAACAGRGYSLEELQRMSIADLDDNEARVHLPERLRRLAAGETLHFEAGHIAKNGEIIPTEVTSRRVIVNNKPAILSVNRDIREQRAAAQAIREERERFELAIRGGRLGTWNWNIATGAVVVNERWTDVLSLGPADTPQTVDALDALVHPDDVGAMRARRDAHLRGETEVYESEHRRKVHGGGWRWVLEVGRLLERGKDGEPLRASGIQLDVDERRKSDEALRASQERFELISRATSDALYDMDMRTGEVWRNEACLQLLGMKGGESAQEGMSRVHPEDAERVLGTTWNTLTSNLDSWAIEFRLRRADGSYVFVLERAYILRGEDGYPIRIIGALTDLTQQRAGEEERLRIQQTLQEAQELESLGVLAGGVAHDFNNLLMGITGVADVALACLPEDSPARPNIRIIATSAQRAAELCHQLLAYAGKGKIQEEAMDLAEVTREMAHLLDLSINRKTELQFDFAPEVPRIDADPAQLRQVVMNLITNASESMEGRPGVVRIAIRPLEVTRKFLNANFPTDALSPGRYTMLEVTDQGCGMSEETQARMFEPFFTTKFTGRGLGLAAVQGIVRAHRGGIRVESEVGVGTRITAIFPVSSRATAPAPKSATPEPPKPRSATVLVVDDEATVRVVAGEALMACGHEVVEAADGAEAVAIFRERHAAIDVVLLDLVMPRLSGEEAYAAMREVNPEVRVILSSGYAEKPSMALFAGCELKGFIQKPYRIEDLQRLVNRVLAEDGEGPTGAPSQS